MYVKHHVLLACAMHNLASLHSFIFILVFSPGAAIMKYECYFEDN